MNDLWLNLRVPGPLRGVIQLLFFKTFRKLTAVYPVDVAGDPIKG